MTSFPFTITERHRVAVVRVVTWCRDVIVYNVSENHAASIFRVSIKAEDHDL
jgi:hypothetical protein